MVGETQGSRLTHRDANLFSCVVCGFSWYEDDGYVNVNTM